MNVVELNLNTKKLFTKFLFHFPDQIVEINVLMLNTKYQLLLYNKLSLIIHR